MATQLNIALENDMQGGTAKAAALADVVPIEPRNGTRLRGLVIPVGGQHWKTVDVEPGRYLVQSVLPSGEMVDREVTVAAGASEDVLLKGDVTPHEWLGWQRFSLERETLWSEGRTAKSKVTASLVPGHHWLERAPAPGQPLIAARSDGRTSAFEVTQRPWATRTFAVVRRDHRFDAVVLPAPWGRYQTSTIQIAVPHDADLSVAVAIQDSELGPLLGYLSAGSLASARKFLQQDDPAWRAFVQMLAEKADNPFGAAVAGYVLLTTAREHGDQYWHAWIENLARRFTWIADGAILAGWLALRDRDRKRAKQWFQDAVQRGIPVVTGTLRLLHEGLLAVNDEASLATVGPALGRADVAQPFVTLRFDENNHG